MAVRQVSWAEARVPQKSRIVIASGREKDDEGEEWRAPAEAGETTERADLSLDVSMVSSMG